MSLFDVFDSPADIPKRRHSLRALAESIQLKSPAQRKSKKQLVLECCKEMKHGITSAKVAKRLSMSQNRASQLLSILYLHDNAIEVQSIVTPKTRTGGGVQKIWRVK